MTSYHMSTYLTQLDKVLADGIARLGSVDRAQGAWVAARQLPDGGFAGRRGEADLYYTDFATRVLALCNAETTTFRHIAHYLSTGSAMPRDVIACFNLLNIARLLAGQGITVSVPRESLIATLSRQRLTDGGYARPGGTEISAYQTFLGALCHEMLGEEMPGGKAVDVRMQALQCPDGGFAESPGDQFGQTNSTAAALAVLIMRDALTGEQAGAALTFLSGLQATDGGLRAHAAAPVGDLLSTFTGLLTLAGLGETTAIDLSGIGRFLRQVAVHAGGFLATTGDGEADIEYTYYGLGVLTLLRLQAG